MFEVINLINQLSADGVKLIFVRQPELSTAGPHGKLLLAIYSYFAEVEREFISVRTQQGLAAARAQGKQLGRPKGSRDKERRAGCASGADQGIPETQNPVTAHSFDSQPAIGRDRLAIQLTAILCARIQSCLICGKKVARWGKGSRRLSLAGVLSYHGFVRQDSDLRDAGAAIDRCLRQF